MSEPIRIPLDDGSFILYDINEGVYRVAYYERRVARSGDIDIAISLAMKKPVHNKRVKEVSKFIAQASPETGLSSLRETNRATMESRPL